MLTYAQFDETEPDLLKWIGHYYVPGKQIHTWAWERFISDDLIHYDLSQLGSNGAFHLERITSSRQR